MYQQRKSSQRISWKLRTIPLVLALLFWNCPLRKQIRQLPSSFFSLFFLLCPLLRKDSVRGHQHSIFEFSSGIWPLRFWPFPLPILTLPPASIYYTRNPLFSSTITTIIFFMSVLAVLILGILLCNFWKSTCKVQNTDDWEPFTVIFNQWNVYFGIIGTNVLFWLYL